MAKTLNLPKLHAAALYFAQHPDLTAGECAIGLRMDWNVSVSHDALRKWQHRPEWKAALETFGHTGDPKFKQGIRRDTLKDAGDDVRRARDTFQELLITENDTTSKAITEVAKRLNLPRQKVYRWHRKGLLT